jgi:hypothetical protein
MAMIWLGILFGIGLILAPLVLRLALEGIVWLLIFGGVALIVYLIGVAAAAAGTFYVPIPLIIIAIGLMFILSIVGIWIKPISNAIKRHRVKHFISLIPPPKKS